MFIQIEGVDGVGKTTQCILLRDWLLIHNIPTIIVKELSSTDLGKKVREILLQGKSNDVVAEMFLFLASKAQVFSEIILPHQAKGECVIADRGSGSFISYNISMGAERELLTDLLNVANFGVVPDLTILLDLPEEAIKERIESRTEKSRFDLLDETHIKRQRQQFLLLARSLPNWIIVDGSLEKEVIHKQIVQEVLGRC